MLPTARPPVTKLLHRLRRAKHRRRVVESPAVLLVPILGALRASGRVLKEASRLTRVAAPAALIAHVARGPSSGVPHLEECVLGVPHHLTALGGGQQAVHLRTAESTVSSK